MINSRKKKLVIVLSALVVLAGTGIFAISQSTNDAPKNSPSKVKTVGNISQPELRPAVISADFDKYKDETLTLTGRVVQVNGEYYLAEEAKTKGRYSALRLDFSKISLDPLQYASTQSADGKTFQPKPPSIVTGKVVRPNETSPPTLVVSDIKIAK